MSDSFPPGLTKAVSGYKNEVIIFERVEITFYLKKNNKKLVTMGRNLEIKPFNCIQSNENLLAGRCN